MKALSTIKKILNPNQFVLPRDATRGWRFSSTSFSPIFFFALEYSQYQPGFPVQTGSPPAHSVASTSSSLLPSYHRLVPRRTEHFHLRESGKVSRPIFQRYQTFVDCRHRQEHSKTGCATRVGIHLGLIHDTGSSVCAFGRGATVLNYWHIRAPQPQKPEGERWTFHGSLRHDTGLLLPVFGGTCATAAGRSMRIR